MRIEIKRRPATQKTLPIKAIVLSEEYCMISVRMCSHVFPLLWKRGRCFVSQSLRPKSNGICPCSDDPRIVSSFLLFSLSSYHRHFDNIAEILTTNALDRADIARSHVIFFIAFRKRIFSCLNPTTLSRNEWRTLLCTYCEILRFSARIHVHVNNISKGGVVEDIDGTRWSFCGFWLKGRCDD